MTFEPGLLDQDRDNVLNVKPGMKCAKRKRVPSPTSSAPPHGLRRTRGTTTRPGIQDPEQL